MAAGKCNSTVVATNQSSGKCDGIQFRNDFIYISFQMASCNVFAEPRKRGYCASRCGQLYFLINNCEQTTQWQSGMALLQQLCCCIQPDGIVYNAAINACSKGAQWRTSETLLRELSRAELQMETVSFNTLASACEKAQQWKDAALTMTSLGSLSIEADVFSFSVALKASRKYQLSWKVASVLDVAWQNQRDQVQPDDVLQNVALIETAEQWQFALMFLSTLQDQADILSYNSAMSTSGRATCWTGAQEILRTMKVQDIQPGVVSCTSLIRACTFGNWQFAEKVLGEFRFRGLQEDVVACTAASKLAIRLVNGDESCGFSQISKVENFKLISLHTMISLVHAPKVLGSNLNRSC